MKNSISDFLAIVANLKTKGYTIEVIAEGCEVEPLVLYRLLRPIPNGLKNLAFVLPRLIELSNNKDILNAIVASKTKASRESISLSIEERLSNIESILAIIVDKLSNPLSNNNQ